MKRALMMAFAAVTLAASVVPANAQFRPYPGRGVGGQEANLQNRIDAGIRSGALTRGEAGRLQSKLNQLRDLSFRMRDSGRGMSFSERQRMQDKLNRLSIDIDQQLTDFDRAFGMRRPGWHR